MSKLMHLDKPVLGETNIYNNATQESDGLMSKEDKIKLDNIDNISTITEEDVTNWGFTKNEGTYIKPEDGIPASDLADGVIPNTDNFMSKNNPIGTGSFSLNRKESTIIGKNSFVVGENSEASGTDSLAMGYACEAAGSYSCAVGFGSRAMSAYSYAEGNSCSATATGAHAEGHTVVANSSYQHVQGEYNLVDSSNKYAHIVGNGTGPSQRSNAHTIDWDGNAWFAGDVEDGSGNKLSDLTNRFTYGTEDLSEDASLADGVFYFVYEE